MPEKNRKRFTYTNLQKKMGSCHDQGNLNNKECV